MYYITILMFSADHLLARSWAQMGVCSELIPCEEPHRQEENADQASDGDFADEARSVP